MHHIDIHPYVKSDHAGYEYLASIYYNMIHSPKKKIILNFSHTLWFDANLSAVLGAIIRGVMRKGYKVTLSNLNNRISGILSHNGFLTEKTSHANIHTEATVPYREFMRGENTIFSEYVINEVLHKEHFPKHSLALGKEIARNIFELYENAIYHGDSNYVHACGQYYPSIQPTRLDFTIVDMGSTFYEKINNYKHQLGKDALDPHGAINWAMGTRNTTKIKRTGGLGLPVILDFLKRNHGKMQIVSDIGFWEYKDGEINAKKYMNYKFPGAIVNIEFNFNDENYYTLDSSKNMIVENIF